MAARNDKAVLAPPGPDPVEHLAHVSTRLWKLIFGVGLVVWLAAAAVTEITDDDILVPTVIIIGSFLVPVTLVAFALSRRREGYLTTEEVVLGFLAAGTLGVIATAVMEIYLLPAAAGTFIGVGIIEELGKALVLIAVAHRVHERGPRDGMVLGAVVGAGFAAFESAGYALQSMLAHLDERPVITILELEAFRALLAPFGHITWTALIGGALFASSRRGRLHLDGRLVATVLGCITLHALWDQANGWAVMLARGVSGGGWKLLWPNDEQWVGIPPSEAVFWLNVFYPAILTVLALIGFTWLLLAWRSYGRHPVAS